MSDKSEVEQVIDGWDHDGPDGAEFKVFIDRLRAAIEADRKVGLLHVPEAIMGQDVRGWHESAKASRAKVERLREDNADLGARLNKTEYERNKAEYSLGEALLGQDRLEAEVERLRAAYVCAPLGGCVADANRRNITRADRAEAKLRRVEALADEWERLPEGVVIDVQTEVVEPFRAALTDEEAE